MREDLKPIARDFLTMLRRDRTERKFDYDADKFGTKMDAHMDRIMSDFRKKINVK